jgi:hypothetical protein
MKIQRSHRSPYIKAVRPMVRADVELLREKSVRPTIQKLTAAHNTMVRLFALGYTNAEVARELGYSASRVSLIRNSPAFVEKLARFTDAADATTREKVDATIELMAQGRALALTKMIEDLEEGELTPAMTVKYFDTFADRTNYHRKTATQNTNINFAMQLEAAFAKSKSVKVIDAE